MTLPRSHSGSPFFGLEFVIFGTSYAKEGAFEAERQHRQVAVENFRKSFDEANAPEEKLAPVVSWKEKSRGRKKKWLHRMQDHPVLRKEEQVPRESVMIQLLSEIEKFQLPLEAFRQAEGSVKQRLVQELREGRYTQAKPGAAEVAVRFAQEKEHGIEKRAVPTKLLQRLAEQENRRKVGWTRFLNQ